MPSIVTDDAGDYKNDHKINGSQQEPEYGDSRKVLVQQLVVLGNVLIVEIGNPKIQQYIKKKGEIKYRKIKAIFSRVCDILNGTVDAENPEWLNQQIKKK